MTPSSSKPLNKISHGTIAGILTALVLWGLRKYAGVELDIEGSALITSLVAVLVQGFVGYMTPLAPGEIRPIDRRIVEEEGKKHDPPLA